MKTLGVSSGVSLGEEAYPMNSKNYSSALKSGRSLRRGEIEGLVPHHYPRRPDGGVRERARSSGPVK